MFYESNYTHSPAALPTPGPGKAIIQDATIKVTINHLLHIGPEEAILPGKGFIIDLSQGFNNVLQQTDNTSVHEVCEVDRQQMCGAWAPFLETGEKTSQQLIL